MKHNIVLIAVGALILGGLGGYGLATQHSDRSWGEYRHYKNREAHTSSGMHHMPDGSMMDNTTTHTGMEMMGNMEMMMVGSEKQFITEMIPHHQEAVDTAKEVLARGATTPAIKTLVEDIITAQEREIADMKNWYEAWYGTAYTPSHTYKPMMRDLTRLSGEDLDQTFLNDMIMHHLMAMMMAHSVQPYIEHEEMKVLTKAISESQSKEIQTMQQLLRDLE
jgi:uncharacterized protein (DUF305 family)